MMDSVRTRLTSDELAERAQQLAHAVRALALLEQEHAEERTLMAATKKAAQRQIADLAEVVRTGVEDRGAQLSMFAKETLP